MASRCADDPGSDGFEVVTDLGGSDAAYAATFLPNGQIVVAGGTNGSPALVAYQLNGSLDPRFGDGGVVLPDFSPLSDARLSDIGVQGKNRILVVGRACDDPRWMELAVVCN